MLRDWLEEQKPRYVGQWNKDTRFPLGKVRLDGVFDLTELENLITYFGECQFEAGLIASKPSEPKPTMICPVWPYDEDND